MGALALVAQQKGESEEVKSRVSGTILICALL